MTNRVCKGIYASLAIAAILIAGDPMALAQIPVYRIGVVVDGPWQDNDAIAEQTRNEILALTAGEFDVRFPPDKQLTADWTQAGIQAAIDRLLRDPDVDMVLAMGVIASSNVARLGDLPKPVIAPVVIDAQLQGLPSKNGGSGVRNLNYLSLPSHVVRDIRVFREIVPFNQVTILLNKVAAQTLPGLQARTEEALGRLGIQPKLVEVGRDVEEAIAALDQGTEAVYLAPLLHLPAADWELLVRTLRQRKLPSFSLFGIREVERGVMATASPDIFPRLARRIALNVQRILLGEAPGALPTAFAIGERVIINMEVAREVDISPPYAVMTEAVLINERRGELFRTVSLASTMRDAVDQNLDLVAKKHFVLAGRQNIELARSSLLPQVEVSALGLRIDEDRADASLGSQAERSLRASLTATQLIFSEPAWANLAIQKHLQKTRQYELSQLRLDIVRAAATTYLQVLRAKTFERIQKENLKRSRSNWELAQVRESIGYSGRSEVFRWESEIALSRSAVIRANSQRNVAEISLNQLLHRPIEEPFETEDADLSQPVLGASREGALDYFDDPVSFRVFRAFMSQEGLRNSPELMLLDAAIAARQREFRSASNSFWSPTIALQFEVSRLLSEAGAGTAGLQLPPSIPLSFPQADDTNWSVGLNASLPLFQGAGRFAQRARASSELKELRTTRRAVADRIELRVRSGLHIAGASRAGIQLSRDAADAAQKNLELVTDAYSRGVLDIIALLDAQNATLNAHLAAANAIYDFMIDLIEVERASGGFYYLAPASEQDGWFGRLQEYFQKAGVSPSGR